MADSGALYTRIAENIALLELLGKVPAAPSHEPYCRPSNESPGYSLSLRAERHLTSTLAFLSSFKDDYLKITAVCLREGENELQVLVAVNAKTSSESEYLGVVVKGFQDIFGLLRKATTTNHEVLGRQVLMAIVAMCHSRILTRAGLELKEDKTRFAKHINEIATKLRGLQRVNNKTLFLNSIERLGLHLNSYVNKAKVRGADAARLDLHLVEIIDESCVLSNISNWRSIILVDLDTVRPRMNPNECQAVVNMVEKLVQYRVSAKTLVDTARRHEIVRKASAVAVRLGEDAFRVDTSGLHTPATTARAAFSRVARSQHSNMSFDVLRSRICPSEKDADTKCNKSLKDALQKSSVHAEMQLIWYLDTHPSSKPPPRIIASHKDACYLCNAFMRFHGMYTVARSHGRLYPCWKLPATGMTGVCEAFAKDLEERVLLRAELVLSGAPRLLEPRESRVNSAVTSLTTILTVDEAVEEEEEAQGSTSDAETIKPEDKTSKSSSGSSSDVVVAEDNAGMAELGVSRVDFALPTAATPSHPNDNQQHLESDSPWQTIEQGRTTTLRLTPKLRIHIEYSALAAASRQELRIRTCELSTAEMAANGAAERVYDVHRDLPLLQDVLCRANCRFVSLQIQSARQQRTRRFRVELG